LDLRIGQVFLDEEKIDCGRSDDDIHIRIKLGRIEGLDERFGARGQAIYIPSETRFGTSGKATYSF
jgi:hypothetical protein